MATNKLDRQPAKRFSHASCSVGSGVIVRGGCTLAYESGSAMNQAKTELANSIEQFDPYLEVWGRRPLKTTGTPHPGLDCVACASVADDVYMYGRGSEERYEGVLSYLDMKKLTWSQLCPEATAGAPMRKFACGLFIVHKNIIVIGGYGLPTGPTQLGASFFKDKTRTDGRGWTNEVHSFNVAQGLWSSPTVKGTRPPPCAYFTLTQIDGHRAVSFGGSQPRRGRVNYLYIFDFNAMEVTCTKVERREGEPWPVKRCDHAACCIGYGGDHVNLLVSGGRDRGGKTLKDMWLFDFKSNTWKEITLPDTIPRGGHSLTATSLCPGLVDVNLFGGTTNDSVPGRPHKIDTIISETTILTFEQRRSEWVMVGVVKNSQRGSSERMREMKERAASLVGERQEAERRVQEALEQADQEEQRAIALVKKNAKLERRLHEMEERVRGSKRQTNVIELEDNPSSDSDKLSSGDLHTVLNLTWDARSKWYNIGLNVGIPVGTLDAVRRNHRDICEDCYRTVLGEWLRDHPSPTWSALEDALRAPSVKMNHIAEQLPNSSKTIESSSSETDEELGSQTNLTSHEESQSSNTTVRRPCCSIL